MSVFESFFTGYAKGLAILRVSFYLKGYTLATFCVCFVLAM